MAYVEVAVEEVAGAPAKAVPEREAAGAAAPPFSCPFDALMVPGAGRGGERGRGEVEKWLTKGISAFRLKAVLACGSGGVEAGEGHPQRLFLEAAVDVQMVAVRVGRVADARDWCRWICSLGHPPSWTKLCQCALDVCEAHICRSAVIGVAEEVAAFVPYMQILGLKQPSRNFHRRGRT